MRILTMFLFLAVSLLAQPKVLFSDLDWGPKTGWEGSTTKGAAVSIWGLNFGSARGTSYVTVNGAQLTAAADYAEWGISGVGVTGAARGLQRTTFWLKSACVDGAGTISVTVGGVTSNTIPFEVAAGAIYFISPSGADTNAGTTAATAWRNAAKFNPAKNPSGDGQYIVYMRTGTYTVFDADEAFVALRGPYGSATKRKALVGYPGETPTFTVTATSRGVIWPANYSPYGRNDYFTFAKLRVTGGTQAFGLWGDYLRVVGNSMEDMRADAWTGVVMVDNSQQVQVLGNLFKNCGYDSYKHNVYIKTHPNYVAGDKSIDYVTVGWNEFADPYAGTDARGGAIFVSRASDSGAKTVDHVYVHSNFFHGGNMEFIYTGDTTPHNGDIWIYNNVLRENTAGAGGMYFAWGTRNVYLYNNTLYSLKGGGGMVAITGGAQVISRNNIYRSTGVAQVGMETYQGATYKSQNDLFFGAATPSGAGVTVTAAKTVDPQFVSVSDLRLAPGSPALGAGVTVAPVTQDYDGNIRSATPSLGAYDVAGAAPPPPVGNVTWSLTPAVGAITPTGQYTAPVTVPSPTTVIVTATATADTSKKSSSTVMLLGDIGVAISPATATLKPGMTQQYSVAIANSTQGVTWSISPSVGTISAAGLYTAPATISAPQAVTVTATSVEDTTRKATAAVSLEPLPAPVLVVAVTPPSVTMRAGGVQQFTATVTTQ